MPGYKAFGAETLTAADVMEYLMRQAVIRVPDAAGLAAIPAPEVNMVAARDDDPGTLYVYNGTTWDGGEWISTTPVLTSSGTAPNIGTTGQAVARYKRIGKTIHYQGRVLFSGTGTAAGTGDYRISLPVVPHLDYLTGNWSLGSVWLYDQSSGTRYLGDTVNVRSDYVEFHTHGATGNAGATSPFAWTTFDRLAWSFTYEAAS